MSTTVDGRPKAPGSWADAITTGAIGVLVAALALPAWDLLPRIGLETSWHLGLSWARDLGIAWGTDLVFTFGPFSWTLYPMVFARDQLVIALALHITCSVVLLLIADHLARTQLGLGRWPALVVAAVGSVLGLLLVPATLLLVLVSSVAMFVRGGWWSIAVTGAMLGVLGHQKLSEASIAASFALFLALGSLSVRGIVGLGLLTAGTWVGLWLALGQGLGALGDHVVNSVDVILGYTQGMGRTVYGIEWHLPLALIIVGLLLAHAFDFGRGMGSRRRLAIVLAVGAASYLSLRAGFARHDHAHLFIFTGYAIAIGIAIVLGMSRGHRYGFGIAAVVLSLCFQGMVAADGLPKLLDRSESLGKLGEVVTVITNDAARSSKLRHAQRTLIKHYGLSPEIIDAVRDEPTMADPWDVSAVWAARAEWDPVPVFQTYSAYTPTLDELNTEHLAARPRNILQPAEPTAIDGRNPAWETPAYRRLIYCEYDAALASEGWEVLEPRGVSRCGGIEPSTTHEVAAGEAVEVPRAPGMVTLATIEPHRSLAQRVAQAIWARGLLQVDYGDARWRWAHGDEARGIMLNAPFDGPGPWGLRSEPFDTISISAPATISFELMEVVEVDEDGRAAPGGGAPIVVGAARGVDAVDSDEGGDFPCAKLQAVSGVGCRG